MHPVAMKPLFLAMAIAIVANADNVRLGYLYKRHSHSVAWWFAAIISIVSFAACYGAAESTKGFTLHTTPLVQLTIGVTLLSLLGLKLVTDLWTDRRSNGDTLLQMGANEMMFIGLLQLMASLLVGIGVGLCGIGILVASIFMSAVCLLGLYTAAIFPLLPQLRITILVSTVSGVLLLMASIVP